MAGIKWPITDTSEEEFFDLLDTPILQGTIIAVSFVSGHSSYLRIGRVRGFTFENRYRSALTELELDFNGEPIPNPNGYGYIWRETRPSQNTTPQMVMEWLGKDEGGAKTWQSDIKSSKIYADMKERFLVVTV